MADSFESCVNGSDWRVNHILMMKNLMEQRELDLSTPPSSDIVQMAPSNALFSLLANQSSQQKHDITTSNYHRMDNHNSSIANSAKNNSASDESEPEEDEDIQSMIMGAIAANDDKDKATEEISFPTSPYHPILMMKMMMNMNETKLNAFFEPLASLDKVKEGALNKKFEEDLDTSNKCMFSQSNISDVNSLNSRDNPYDYICTTPPPSNNSEKNSSTKDDRKSSKTSKRKSYSKNRRLVPSTVSAPQSLLQPSDPSMVKLENPIYRCHLCSYTGNSKIHFNAHMNTHFDHRCPHCDYTSRTEGRLKRHIRDFHSETPPETWSGTGRMKSDDSNSQLGDGMDFGSDDGLSPGGTGPNPARNRKYRCKQCGYVAMDKHDFWEHSKGHIKSDKMLACPKCNFVTEYKHHLEYHLRNHFGSKPFKCAKCNYSCVNKSMLNSHMKSHSNIYQYRCEDCTYATKYCHSLKLHLRKYSHRPSTVLNLDGTPNPYPVIDVYGTRRGPRPKKNSKPPMMFDSILTDEPSQDTLNDDPNEDKPESEFNNLNQSMSISSSVSSAASEFSFSGLDVSNKSDIVQTTHQTSSDNLGNQKHFATKDCANKSQDANESKKNTESSQNGKSTNNHSQASILKCNYCPFQTESKPDFSNHLLNHVKKEKASLVNSRRANKPNNANAKVSPKIKEEPPFESKSESNNLSEIDSKMDFQTPADTSLMDTATNPTSHPESKSTESNQSTFQPLYNYPSSYFSPSPGIWSDVSCMKPALASFFDQPTYPQSSIPFGYNPASNGKQLLKPLIDSNSLIPNPFAQLNPYFALQPSLPVGTMDSKFDYPDQMVNASKAEEKLFDMQESKASTPLDLSGSNNVYRNGSPVMPLDDNLLNGANPTNSAAISALLLMNSFLLNAQQNFKDVLVDPDEGMKNAETLTDNCNKLEQDQELKSTNDMQNKELEQFDDNKKIKSRISVAKKRKGQAKKLDLNTLDTANVSEDDDIYKYSGLSLDVAKRKRHLSGNSFASVDSSQTPENTNEKDLPKSVQAAPELALTQLENERKTIDRNEVEMDLMMYQNHQLPPTPTKSPKNSGSHMMDSAADRTGSVFDFDRSNQSNVPMFSSGSGGDDGLSLLMPNTAATAGDGNSGSETPTSSSAIAQMFMQMLSSSSMLMMMASGNNPNNISAAAASLQQTTPTSTPPPPPPSTSPFPFDITDTSVENVNNLINKMYSATSLMQEILVEMCTVKK